MREWFPASVFEMGNPQRVLNRSEPPGTQERRPRLVADGHLQPSAAPVRPLCQHDGTGTRGCFQKIKRALYDAELSVPVAGRPNRAPHGMGGQQHPRQGHHSHPRLKGLNGDDDGGNTGFFQKPRHMSDGHVANRSDRHQQSGCDLLGLEAFDPFGAVPFQQSLLAAGPDKAVGHGRQFTDHAGQL